MADKVSEPERLWPLGAKVGIRYSDWRGKIVELRGPLGPKGVQVYRVRIRRKPKATYTEVLGDQLIALPGPAESAG